MTEPLQVAIIGAGKIAQMAHLPGYARAGAQVVALCDNSSPQLESLAAEQHVQRYYRDWRQMLEEGGFSAVSICTPPAYHCEMAVEAVRRGYHVLVEKPMAVHLEECERMETAAARAGVVLMVSHNQRFMAPHVVARETLQSGVLGRPYLVHATFCHGGPERWSPTQQWYFKPDLAGQGVLADLGIHKLDLMRWLLGQEIVEVAAMGATFEKATTLPDSAICAIRFADGALGTLQVSWVYRPDWENSIMVQCESGTLRVATEPSEPLVVHRVSREGGEIETTHRCINDDPSGWYGAVRAFVQAVCQGDPSPVPASEGRAALAAVLAAWEAMRQHTVVRLA